MVIIKVIIMVIITVIMVIIMVLCLGIGLQGIKMSESQTNAGNQPSCQVVRLSSLISWDLGHAEQLLFLCLCTKATVFRRKWHWFFTLSPPYLFQPTSDINISETVYPIYLKINVQRVASGDSLHFNF